MKEREEAIKLTRNAEAFDESAEHYVDMLCQAAKKDPYYSEPHILLGFHYFKERQWKMAEQSLEKAIQLDYLLDNNEEMAEKVYITLGKVYQMEGRKEKSLHIFKAFAGLFPYSRASEKLIAQIYSRYPEVDRWFSCFRKGYNQLLAQNHEEALVLFDKALALYDGFSWLYYYVGRAFAGLKHYEEAEASYRKAMELEEHFIFLYGLHGVYSALEKKEEAHRSIERALELNPFYHLVLLSKEMNMRRFQLKNGKEAVAKGNLITMPSQHIQEAAMPGHDLDEYVGQKKNELARCAQSLCAAMEQQIRENVDAVLKEEMLRLKDLGKEFEASLRERMTSVMEDVLSEYSSRARRAHDEQSKASPAPGSGDADSGEAVQSVPSSEEQGDLKPARTQKKKKKR